MFSLCTSVTDNLCSELKNGEVRSHTARGRLIYALVHYY